MGSKGKCNVCENELAANSVLCIKCETAHCEQCFTYAGNCSTYGCGSKAYRKQETIDIIYNLEDNSKTIDSKALVLYKTNSISDVVDKESNLPSKTKYIGDLLKKL